MDQPSKDALGPIIDGLGCTPTLDQDDLVAAAVVVMKVIEPNGTVRLSISWSDGLGWIERLGMLRAAERIDLPVEADTLDD
jgi:hypothetical protein